MEGGVGGKKKNFMGFGLSLGEGDRRWEKKGGDKFGASFER